MEHRTLNELRTVADLVRFQAPTAPMTRRQRLLRWAAVLERHDGEPLRPLMRVEFLPEYERLELRAENSPLAVAFRDPVLREEGLKGDTLGDAMTFFDLEQRDAHFLVCDCHYRGAMTATGTAARVRSLANQITLREVWGWMKGVFGRA